ncbi:cyclin-D3-3-like [Diospyros lotus]|uniref:cyclin-D3-3-like n=1 Tax=Diospyros lotus TaxID=55363 RepID=UPI0022594821|nr:cyclin-D3-3-like [Diospyros lotus]
MAQPRSQPQPQNHPFLLDSLYCQEDHWEAEDERVDVFGQQEQEEAEENQNLIPKPPLLLEQDLVWEDEELASLLSKQQETHLYNALQNDPSLASARREAVDWMLKVNAHYSFSALTAVLAVNYLDRFLFGFQFRPENPWMTQLAAVACLSLAAKVEETHVPLLLDFQVEESRYVFEAKAIQRMEVLVLSTLQWRMNPVTPLSFLDHIARRLGLKNHLCWEFLKRCECLFVSIISDCMFTGYLPSVLAAATMLHVVNSVEPCLAGEYQNQLLAILGIDTDKLEDCYKRIHESSLGHQSHKRKLVGSVPGSPNGVMEACFSSDSSNDSWAVTASVSSSPEPLLKKSRSQEQYCHAAEDILS